MDMWLPILISIVELVVTGLLFLMLPRLTRRGLLFGTYVGGEAAASPEARRMTRSWYTGMAVTLCACVGAGGAFVLAGRPAAALVIPDALLLVGLGLCYYRAHRAAVKLAALQGPAIPMPPPAVASLTPSKPGMGLPVMVLLVAATVGVVVMGYAWSNYDSLPDRVPTHFSGSGRPDAWSDRSFASVMTLPLGTLFTGIGLAALGCFLAKSKRALRLKDGGVSLAAQERFRTAIVAFLCVETLLVTAMMGTMSVDSIRVGLGRTDRMSGLMTYLAITVGLFSLAGVIYIALRYGQGGARLESAAGAAPLTDGLADNEKWKLGAFYVNRDDPAMFIEHRFGIGYTLNFGNAKAVAFLVTFFLLVVILPLILVFTM